MDGASDRTETTEYRLALIEPSSNKLLSLSAPSGSCLPRVEIPKWTRRAKEINEAIYREWRLKTIVLSYLPSTEKKPACAVAEVIAWTGGVASRDLVLEPLDAIDQSELTMDECYVLSGIISGTAPFRGPFSRLGWFRDAQDWIRRSVTNRLVDLRDDFCQYSGSDTFALMRMDATDGRSYWLKATGQPNIHECALTVELSRLLAHYVPSLVAVRKDWNAWVTEDAGASLGYGQDLPVLVSAVESLADLQISSLSECEALKAAGCIDRGLSRLRLHLEEMFSFLEEIMQLQTSTKVRPLTSARLREIAAIVDKASERMQELGIPDCLVNGDINLENILFDGETFRFTDWAEGGIGNPFLTLQQVIQHVIRDGEHLDWVSHLCTAYKMKWLDVLEEQQIDSAFALMPLLAMAEYLYGRGDWLNSSRRNDASFQSFARTVGRCMDRAATELLSLEASPA